MTFETLTIERDGPVALVRFDRKGNLNAINRQVIDELTQAALAFQREIETRAVVLTGAPQAFSAGMDLKERAQAPLAGLSALERRDYFYGGVRLCRAWEEMPQITIAAIEKMAVGGGLALALALDWRVIADDAFLYVPEVKVGLNLQWGALPRLIGLVGPARAKRICILCEKMSAKQALDWGLAEETAPPGRTQDKALTLARAAAAMPGVAARMIKQGVNATAGALFQAASFADADQSQLTSLLGDSQEAITEFSKGKK